MKIIRTGVTRTVILVGRWAVKVPSFRGHMTRDMRGRIAAFCTGVLANQSEYMWHEYKPWAGQVAPVQRSWLWGIVQIYPRCIPLTYAHDEALVPLPVLDPDPGDHKPDNFGWLDRRIVRLDYDMD